MKAELGPLQEADLDQVCAIETACFATPWARALFLEELKRPELCHWLAAKDTAGRVLGYGGFWKAVDEAHFTNVAVDPRHQRQGLGRALVAALLDKARSLGCVRATLEVRLSNLAAQQLYQGFGFEPAALRKGYYSDNGEDALLMWLRTLAPSSGRAEDAHPGPTPP